MGFTFTQTGIEGLVVIEPKLYGDERGYFAETWNLRDFEQGGLPMQFVQDNQSKSQKGVLRGMHYQIKNPQGKLVRVVSGRVFDVAVDLRKNSPTCGKWYGITLCAEKMNMLYVPEGFAHGFLTLTEYAEFTYKCTRFYDPRDEGGLQWNDPDVGIGWPDIGIPFALSEKDKNNTAYSEVNFF